MPRPCAPGCSRNQPRFASATALRVEPLEPRVVLSTVTWDWGGGDRLWSNPLNWSGDVVPGEEDDVTIDLGPTIDPEMMVADLPVIRVKSLILNETLVVNRGTSFNVNESFDIMAEGALRINGLTNWAKGIWNGDIAVRVHPGGLLNVGSSLNPGVGEVTLASDLLNLGTFNWNGGDIALGGLLTNSTGKAFNLASPGTIFHNGSGTASILNRGLLRRGGDAAETSTLAVSLTNTNRLYSLRGTLTIGDPSVALSLDRGRIVALDADSHINLIGATSSLNSADTRLDGLGTITFLGGVHTLSGWVIMGFGPREFLDGAQINSASSQLILSADILLDDVTVDLGDGDMIFHSYLPFGGPPSMRIHTIRNTVFEGSPDRLLRFFGTVYATGVTFNTRTDAGGGLFVGESGSALPGVAFNAGTNSVSLGLHHLSGDIGIAAGASLRVWGELETSGGEIGSGPSSGTLNIAYGYLTRTQAPGGPDTTTISARLNIEFSNSSQPNDTVRVFSGTLAITGQIAQLAVDQATGLWTLEEFKLEVWSGAVLELPAPLEVIADSAEVRLKGGGGEIPQLRGLRELHGLLSFDQGHSTPFEIDAPVLLNHGSVSSGGSVVFNTPIDNHGGISCYGGTFEVTGLLNADDEFVNEGSIFLSSSNPGAQLVINVDQPGRPATMVNRGRIKSNLGSLVVRGSFRGEAGSYIDMNAGPGLAPIQVTRTMEYGGQLIIGYVGGAHTLPFSIVPIQAQTYVGTFAIVAANPEPGQVHYMYLPSGALQMSWS